MHNMSQQTASRTDPEHIAISKSKGIRIDWKDGHHSSYDLDYLRENCPCATCAGTHGTPTYRQQREQEKKNPLHMYQAALRMVSVEPVGNYAIRITWSDGHNTGIYSFDTFRALCPCEECTAARAAQQ
jgi:DUF971 family protein